jgi:hypothetical protein
LNGCENRARNQARTGVVFDASLVVRNPAFQSKLLMPLWLGVACAGRLVAYL